MSKRGARPMIVVMVKNRYGSKGVDAVFASTDLRSTEVSVNVALRDAGFDRHPGGSWIHPRSGCTATVSDTKPLGDLRAYADAIAKGFADAGAPLPTGE